MLRQKCNFVSLSFLSLAISKHRTISETTFESLFWFGLILIDLFGFLSGATGDLIDRNGGDDGDDDGDDVERARDQASQVQDLRQGPWHIWRFKIGNIDIFLHRLWFVIVVSIET